MQENEQKRTIEAKKALLEALEKHLGDVKIELEDYLYVYTK